MSFWEVIGLVSVFCFNNKKNPKSQNNNTIRQKQKKNQNPKSSKREFEWWKLVKQEQIYCLTKATAWHRIFWDLDVQDKDVYFQKIWTYTLGREMSVEFGDDFQWENLGWKAFEILISIILLLVHLHKRDKENLELCWV